MQYTVKRHSKSDFYYTYVGFLNQHLYPVTSAEALPENCFVVYNENLPIYVMWFYFTDSKVGICTFMTSNRLVDYNKKYGAKKVLLEEIIKYAKKKKLLSLYSPTMNSSVIQSLLAVGFEQAESGSGEYFKRL